jgi:hypothetical protein
MSLANKRQEMMLAQTRQWYVAYQDRISRGLHETHIQMAGGIFAQAREEVRVGVGDAFGGAEDAFAVWILTYAYEDLAHSPLDALPVHPALSRL